MEQIFIYKTEQIDWKKVAPLIEFKCCGRLEKLKTMCSKNLEEKGAT